MSVLTKAVILFYLCQTVVGDFCLKAKLNRYTSEDYDGVDGNLAATIDGSVHVRFESLGTTMMNLEYNIYGGARGCDGCGIHIHEGTTCMYHQIVKGHYWYPGPDGNVSDPWTKANGAVYTTGMTGDASGSFTIDAGLNYMANLRHAVVLHDGDGNRYGCGILEFVECPAHKSSNTQNTQNTQKKQKKAKKKNKANKAKGRRRKL